MRVLAFQSNTTKIPREDTQRDTKRAKKVAGGKKSAKFWALPTLRLHPSAPPFGAHPSGPTLLGPIFSGFGPNTLRLTTLAHPLGPHPSEPDFFPTLWVRTLAPDPELDWPKLLAKIGLAKIGFGQNWPGQNHDGPKWIGQNWIGHKWSNQDGQNGIGQSRSLPSAVGVWGRAVHGKIGQAKAGGQSWPKSAWPHQNRPKSAKLKVVARVGETVAKEGCGQSGASRHSTQGDRAQDRRPQWRTWWRRHQRRKRQRIRQACTALRAI